MYRIPAKVDYALRAIVALAATGSTPVKGERLAREHGIPFRFLETVLGELRHHGLVASRRGSDGGYWLGRPAGAITVAEVITALEGGLTDVRSLPPLDDAGDAHLAVAALWDALADGLDGLLGSVTVADLVAGEPLPMAAGVAAGPARTEPSPAPATGTATT